jgi:hypothetical protein
LTPAVFVDDSTRIDADTSAADPIAIRLELTARAAGGAAAALFQERHRIALLNLPMPLDSVVIQ